TRFPYCVEFPAHGNLPALSATALRSPSTLESLAATYGETSLARCHVAPHRFGVRSDCSWIRHVKTTKNTVFVPLSRVESHPDCTYIVISFGSHERSPCD